MRPDPTDTTDSPGFGGWWRLYALSAPGVHCRIHEAFPANLLRLLEESSETCGDGEEVVAHLGDIMGMQTDCAITGADFSPLERILLTANGNVQRIMSAYYHTPVQVRVRACRRLGPGRYRREVDMAAAGEPFMVATALVDVLDADLLRAIEGGSVSVGAVFRAYDILPRFRLLAAGRSPSGGLWRTYRLSSPRIVCEIKEDFHPHLFELIPTPSPAIPADMPTSDNLRC